MVKNLPAMQKTRVRSLGWEDPLVKGTATHSSILAGESHGKGHLAGYSPWGCKDLDTIQRQSMCKRVLDTTDFSTGLGILVLNERAPQVSTSWSAKFSVLHPAIC